MRADYEFVRELASGNLSEQALARARAAAVPGSHVDIILKENLLDRVYDRTRVIAGARSIRDDDYIVSSFPSDLLDRAAINVRSEFLILRSVGCSAFDLDASDALITATLASFRPHGLRRIIYRLCDYDESDFSFFSERAYPGLRGAQRLLEDERLLDYDLRMVDAFLSEGIPVDVLVPFVQFPDQLTHVRRHIDGFFRSTRRPSRVGTTFEVPVNLFRAHDFSAADFFVFGVSDLLKFFYGGVDRNSRQYQKVDVEVLLGPVKNALAAVDAMGGRTVYLMKSLIDVSDRLGLDAYTRTTFRRFFMPNQLEAIAEAAQLRR